jgi:hypothetical protein
MKPIFVHRTATLVIFLALILVACAAPPASTEQPTSAPPEPTQTPVVIVETVVEKVVETVVVTVVPTQAPTELPSVTPLPPPTEIPPTKATEVTRPPAPTVAAPANTSGGRIAVDNVLGAGWFVDMTRTRNDFALRCQLSKEITFSVKPTDPNITQVDFYYRIQDRATGAVFDWQNAGRMISDANDNFTIVFSGDDVNANFRKPNAWFDYQFIGSSRTGVVGRSEKIEQQVTYTFDCP